MRNRVIGSIFAAMAALALSPVIVAQTAAQSGAAKAPNISGVWAAQTRKEAAVSKLPPMPKSEPAAMTKWGQEQFAYLNDPRPNDTGERVRNELDPTVRCFPPGVARMVIPFGRMEIFQTPREVVMVYEDNHEVRHIYMDGRKHPEGEDLELSWNGHSIGKWDGDALVVDTVGIRPEPLLDGGGRAHSDKLHMTERYRTIAPGVLQIDVTYEDPIALAKPWTKHALRVLRTTPEWDLELNTVCEEKYRKGIWGGQSPSGL